MFKPVTQKVVNKGNFYPSTSLTPEGERYQSFKYGWLIDYGMNVYNGHWARTIGTTSFTPPPHTMFNPIDVDVKSWAIAAAERNVDYAVLNVRNEYGFHIYNSSVKPSIVSPVTINTRSGGFNVPYYDSPYCVRGQADPNIVDKFVVEFRQRGIEPCFYINTAADSILADGITSSAGFTGQTWEQVDTYYCLMIQELLLKYKVKYLWFDYAATMNAGSTQKYYNAAKAIDPTVTIIGNVIGETDFGRFPYDIQSTEEYAIYGGNTAYQTTSRTHNGTTYYIPQEVVATPYGTFSQWYYYDDLCPVQPLVSPFDNTTPYVKMATQTIGEFQGIVDLARAYNRPVLAAMFVDRYGDLVQHTLDYLDQIDFT